MTDDALLRAERRGRAVAQREWLGGGAWRVYRGQDDDGPALAAAARLAARFGAAVALEAAAVSRLAIIRDGVERTAAPPPDADVAWRTPLADQGPWVREAGPGDTAVSCAACREVDRRAIHDHGVPGVCLMEHAAIGAVAVATAMLAGVRGPRVFVAVGGGNNGGDGLALARGLAVLGVETAVGLFKPEAALGGDAAINMRLLRAHAPDVAVLALHEGAVPDHRLAGADLIVDGLLGTGFRGGLSPLFRKAVAAINRSGRPVLALDLPSGLDGDNGAAADDTARAAATVTFAAVKTGLTTPGAAGLVGRLYLADIGAPGECYAGLE